LALVAILLAFLAVAAAWMLRPRQEAVRVTALTAPAQLDKVKSAIDDASRQRVKALLLETRFTGEGTFRVPVGGVANLQCQPDVVDQIDRSAGVINGAKLPVSVLVMGNQADPCATEFARRVTTAGLCIWTRVPRYCSSPEKSGSRRGMLAAFLVAVLLATSAWALLRRPRRPTAPPSAPAEPPPPPTPRGPLVEHRLGERLPVEHRPTLERRPVEHRLGGHPLAGRLRQPQPAEVRSMLDPAGFVAFEGGLWRAEWTDPHRPPPGIGAPVLIQYDERTAQLVAIPSR
jgi:hypothetical protein